jgi:soluble cytochrome b562
MKKRPLILTLALLLVTLPFVQANHHEEEEHHTELEDQMSAMNKAWRSIRRQIKDPAKNESTLALVAKVKAGAQKSLDLTPMLAEEQKGAAKEKFMAGYLKAMKRTVGLIGQLEKALKAGDNAGAAAIVGKLNDARKKGHENFKPEDED